MIKAIIFDLDNTLLDFVKMKENAISVNQVKGDENFTLGAKDLIAAQYILLRRGKKNYFILKVAS